MLLELSQTTFRRLVWLQLVLLPVFIAEGTYQALNQRWAAFDTDFNQLLVEHFSTSGEFSDLEAIASGVLMLLNIAALVGLLRFRTWARTLYLLIFVMGYPLMWFYLAPATYYTLVMMALEAINGLAGGASLVMAYGGGLGSEWFARSDRAAASGN